MNRPKRALEQARSIDGAVRALGEALALGRDTARSAPLRRAARGALDRQEEISRHLDFAVRNTRVLARDALRYARGGGLPVPEIADAVDDLAEAVWALAAVFDNPGARQAGAAMRQLLNPSVVEAERLNKSPAAVRTATHPVTRYPARDGAKGGGRTRSRTRCSRVTAGRRPSAAPRTADLSATRGAGRRRRDAP